MSPGDCVGARRNAAVAWVGMHADIEVDDDVNPHPAIASIRRRGMAEIMSAHCLRSSLPVSTCALRLTA